MSKTGRNDPCPCGSGKKYKQCCLLRDEIPATTNKHAINTSIPQSIQEATAHHQAGRLAQAEAGYRQILQIEPDNPDALHLLGLCSHQAGRNNVAVELIKRAISINSGIPAFYLNLGVAIAAQGNPAEATANFRKALSLKPDLAPAHYNLGNSLVALGRYDDAVACFRRALAINPNHVKAHSVLGNALGSLGRYDEAATSCLQALNIDPDCELAFGMFLHAKMHCCSWGEFDDTSQAFLRRIDTTGLVSNPFHLLAIPTTLAQQKKCAEIYVQEKYPEVPLTANVSNRYSHDKIRLGYFSSDFYNHATAHLMAELLEQHDRSKFEVIGISFGASPDDTMRQRLSTAFDRFIDVHHQSDAEICALARSLEIDIAIDLKGFTGNARTGIFALRPAPVQVNYLGYPGTMGAPYMDYLIADPTLIPLEHQPYYTEKIAYLPDSYQVNDSHRQISARLYTRSEVGLPEAGFVFCCFNNNYKITPVVFDIWMQLLKQVEGSVLWLYEGNPWATQNLLSEAAKRGVAPERLVFAKRMDLPEHLARHRLADLFLDTFYCNAHTTASDALWAGLPVLTLLGDTFAGRVAASLLNAIGLPELITHTHDEYKTLALALATQPDKLALLRQQLAKNRTTQPLFNTERYTRHIEEAYTRMWQRHQEALVPEHMYVGKVNE